MIGLHENTVHNFNNLLLEHISLEEISSDSNDEIGKSKRKRKVPATTSKSVKAVAEEKNGKPGKNSKYELLAPVR